MPEDAKRKAACRAMRVAQKEFERESDAANRARRKAFAQAQQEGPSLREIGEEVGLTHSASRRSSMGNKRPWTVDQRQHVRPVTNSCGADNAAQSP